MGLKLSKTMITHLGFGNRIWSDILRLSWERREEGDGKRTIAATHKGKSVMHRIDLMLAGIFRKLYKVAQAQSS